MSTATNSPVSSTSLKRNCDQCSPLEHTASTKKQQLSESIEITDQNSSSISESSLSTVNMSANSTPQLVTPAVVPLQLLIVNHWPSMEASAGEWGTFLAEQLKQLHLDINSKYDTTATKIKEIKDSISNKWNTQ